VTVLIRGVYIVQTLHGLYSCPIVVLVLDSGPLGWVWNNSLEAMERLGSLSKRLSFCAPEMSSSISAELHVAPRMHSLNQKHGIRRLRALPTSKWWRCSGVVAFELKNPRSAILRHCSHLLPIRNATIEEPQYLQI
jgi:hypothetical protein